LPFLGHGLGGWTTEITGCVEDGGRGYEAVDSVTDNLPTFARRSFGSRPMGAKCNPVCCRNTRSIPERHAMRGACMQHTCFLLVHCQFIPIVLHSVTKGHPQVRLLLRWHRVPSRLNIRQCRVGNSVGFASLLLLATNITVDDGCTKSAMTCSHGSEAGGRGRDRRSKERGTQHSGEGVARRAATACPMD